MQDPAVDQRFHEERRRMIGGTDSPAIILGKHFDKTPLSVWAQKTGQPMAKAVGGDLDRGITMEPIIRDLYAKKTGRRIEYNPRAYFHPEFTNVGCHIDGIIYDDAHDGPGVLEIKCPRLAGYYKNLRNGLSQEYLIQHQHCMAVTGMKWGAFAFFNCEIWEMKAFDLEYLPDIGEFIMQKSNHFWETYIETGVRPPDIGMAPWGIPIAEAKENIGVHRTEDQEWNNLAKKYRQKEEAHFDAKVKADAAKSVFDEASEALKQKIRELCEEKGTLFENLWTLDYDIAYQLKEGRKSFRKKDLIAAKPLDRKALTGRLCKVLGKDLEEVEAMIDGCDVDFGDYERKGASSDVVKVFSNKARK